MHGTERVNCFFLLLCESQRTLRLCVILRGLLGSE
jgi:hypothetical protein